MKDNPAFSLLEVLITVAALIITTIVVSNWLQSRRSTQHLAAAAQPRATYTGSFMNIPFDQALMSSRFSGSYSSYNVIATESGPNNTANAYPTSIGNGRF
jgi:hypothetical protein